MATAQKKYSSSRFWRFVFTPLLLFIILLGLFLLFTSSDTQTGDFASVARKANSLLAASSAPVLNSAKNTGSFA